MTDCHFYRASAQHSYAQRDTVISLLSDRLSVCMSHAGIALKRLNRSLHSKDLDYIRVRKI